MAVAVGGHPPGRRSDDVGGGAARLPAGEDAAAQERAFQGVVAVHAAAAEPGDLSGGIQAGDGLAVVAHRAGVKVGLDADVSVHAKASYRWSCTTYPMR